MHRAHLRIMVSQLTSQRRGSSSVRAEHPRGNFDGPSPTGVSPHLTPNSPLLAAAPRRAGPSDGLPSRR